MSRVVLRLECIQDDAVAANRALRRMDRSARTAALARMPMQRQVDLINVGCASPWVAEVTIADDGTIQRKFLDGLKDYAAANGTGSRGVYRYFVLRDGPTYEIFDRPKWDQKRRRFARVIDGKLRELSISEVLCDRK